MDCLGDFYAKISKTTLNIKLQSSSPSAKIKNDRHGSKLNKNKKQGWAEEVVCNRESYLKDQNRVKIKI